MSSGKVMKTLNLATTAQESHNVLKLKSLLKWLKSGHEVKVQITGKADRQKAMENIFQQVEKEVKTGANVIQKLVKPDSIRFYLRPTKEAENFVIETTSKRQEDGDGLDGVTVDKDILSDEFERELDKSIKEDRQKTKRK